MKRSILLALLMFTAVGLTPAFGGILQDNLVSQLHTQGFFEISVSRTWLGRTKIKAVSKKFSREIVVNPRTGEILRDFWLPLDGEDSTGVQLLDPDDSDTSDGSDDGADSGGDDNDNSGGDDNDNSGGDDNDNSGGGGGDNSGGDD